MSDLVSLEDRGFKDGNTYVTRFGEKVELNTEDYERLKVFEDILNRLLFVNTRDLKRALETSNGFNNKKPQHKPGGGGPYKPRGFKSRPHR